MINHKIKKNSLLGNHNPIVLYVMLLIVIGVIIVGIVSPEKFALITGKITSLIVDNFG